MQIIYSGDTPPSTTEQLDFVGTAPCGPDVRINFRTSEGRLVSIEVLRHEAEAIRICLQKYTYNPKKENR